MTRSPDTPMREGSRDGWRNCPICDGPLPSTRARYCSRACQQRAFRLRQRIPMVNAKDVRRELQQRRALVAHTIYECGECGERLVGERRCSDCGLFCRALGLGGRCPDCDVPVLLTDLLGEGVVPIS